MTYQPNEQGIDIDPAPTEESMPEDVVDESMFEDVVDAFLLCQKLEMCFINEQEPVSNL